MDRNRRSRKKVFLFILAGLFGLILLGIAGFQFIEYTESSAFCGQVCHEPMGPEYTAYQASAHSRVECSECHIGPGLGPLVESKIRGISELYENITGNYERPIQTPVTDMRPGRETCEHCHRPEKFSGDMVRTHTTYLTNEANTEQVDTRVLRIGGGESSVASDIHWHIAANVWYLSDETRQKIAWIGVEDADGKYKTEYLNPLNESNPSPTQIREGKRLMDCMDCHNRATHVFRTPEELIDTAMVQGKIDKTLPYIKREGARVLYPPNPSLEQADAKIEAIVNFYKTSYPEVYASKKASIDKAISELKEVARLTTFPHMKVTWETYADNIGHRQSEGCYRCHDKLVATTGSEKGKTVDVNCNLCHYPIKLQ